MSHLLTCTSPAHLESAIRDFESQFSRSSKKSCHERLLLYRYLRKCKDTVQFPIEATHSDKPDFVLKTAQGIIGLEAVLLTTEALEKGQVLAATRLGNVSLDLTELLVKDQIRPLDAIESMIGEKAIPAAIPVADLEQKWCNRLRLLLADKAVKIQGYGLDTIDLLVGDQLSFNDAESRHRVTRFGAGFNPTFSSAPRLRVIMIAGSDDAILIERAANSPDKTPK